MNKYNPTIHHRRSIRLKGYDYSQAGLYFITICSQNRICHFGKIENGEMTLNDAGNMVKNWYYELENKFHDVKCHEMIVMPNHVHCIVENVGLPVGADLRVCPDPRVCPNDIRLANEGEHVGSPQRVGSPLHRVVQWFKTMTTNEYIRGVKTLHWPPFNGKLWQRNYYEHIIRNDKSYQTISEYITNNPAKWKDDKFYT